MTSAANLPALLTGMDSQLAPADDVLARLETWSADAAGSFADNTSRAWRADTGIWISWCQSDGSPGLPAEPETIARFLKAQAREGKGLATLKRYAASLARLHRAADLPDPTKTQKVDLAMRAIARAIGSRQDQADPLNYDDLVRIIESLGWTDPEDRRRLRLIDLRDGALLQAAYDGLFRRSELLSLQVEDLEDSDTGGSGVVLLRRSKTDQAGQGAKIYLAARTMAWLKGWLEQAGIEHGPIFRAVHKSGSVSDNPLSDIDVNRIFSRRGRAAGIAKNLSGHSARVGCAQDMARKGFSLAEIMQAGRWKSTSSLLRYIENILASQGAAAKLAEEQGR